MRAMTKLTLTTKIQAPVERVFRAVTDIEALPSTNPDILHIEFLSQQRSGVGTRFKETRRMGKSKSHVTELEVTEYEAQRHARMVTRGEGTVWDTSFDFAPDGDGTKFTLAMDARAKSFFPRMMIGIFKPMIRRGIAKHLDSVRQYCESKS